MLFLNTEEALKGAATSVVLDWRWKATGACVLGETKAEAVMVPAMNELNMDAAIFILIELGCMVYA